jgi:protein ImuB
MPLVEAQTLVRGLGVAPAEPEADCAALVKWAEVCERFSPRVALEDGPGPESLLFDVSNLEHLWESESQLVEQVRKFFTGRGYLARLGVGEAVGAAWAAAHFGKSPNDECRMTNEKTLGSSFVIRHSSFALPVQSLRIPEETAITLRELGIETVGQLMALPREGLAARFGDELLRRLDQLTGTGREVIEPRRALAPLETSYALEEPTGDRVVLMHVLAQLVDPLARELAARDQGAVLLVCSLHTAGMPLQQLRVGLLQPSASTRQLLELLELHLETVKLAGEVERVELRAAVVGRLGERQGELFVDRWPIDPHQLAVLVNRLSSRLGSERVLRAEPRASAVPERAVGWKAAIEKGGAVRKIKDKETRRQGDKEIKRVRVNKKYPHLPISPSPCLPPRPLLLYPQPHPLDVVCVAPDGPPQFVWFESRREAIVGCVGPERIETLWWRGAAVRRDYYRIATESGAHLWMFRRLTDGHWFVHGVFV